MDDWDFQGEISTTDLENAVNEYAFPSDILKIKRIELSYDGTTWRKATFFDVNQKQGGLTGNETKDYAENDPFVEVYENSMFIYPTPTADVTAGLKIWYSKEIVGVDNSNDDIASFSTSTDSPNLKEAFQKGLAYGAAKDYFIQFKDWESVKRIDEELEKIIARMRVFYGSRIQDRKVIIQGASSMEDYE
jgi:hypothetical protein